MEALMCDIAKVIGVILVLITGVIASPAHAQINADVAKKCRALMVKAHPIDVFGSTGSAAAQRSYFQECVRRRGDMPDEKSTTGKGN
jgi:hypothetical protein